MKANEVITNTNKMNDKIDMNFPKAIFQNNVRFSKLRHLPK